jgi:hypothetical protein
MTAATAFDSWGLAEHAGLATPRPFEHLLDGAVWDADLLRDHVRDYMVAGLGYWRRATEAPCPYRRRR